MALLSRTRNRAVLHIFGVDLGQDLTDRRLSFQHLLQSHHQHSLSLHRVAFSPDDLLFLVFDSLQAFLDGCEVAEKKLELERLDIPRRINRAFDVRHVWVIESTGDKHERVSLTQMTEQAPLIPFLAMPLAIPATSRYWTSAGTRFSGRNISVSRSRRASGTFTVARFGSSGLAE